jgi:hypothetical protein
VGWDSGSFQLKIFIFFGAIIWFRIRVRFGVGLWISFWVRFRIRFSFSLS